MHTSHIVERLTPNQSQFIKSGLIRLTTGMAPAPLRRTNLPEHLQSLGDEAERHVLAVQPGDLGGADEELGAVGVGPVVHHRYYTWRGEWNGEATG